MKSLITIAPEGWRVDYNDYGVSLGLSAALVKKAEERKRIESGLPEPAPPEKVEQRRTALKSGANEGASISFKITPENSPAKPTVEPPKKLSPELLTALTDKMKATDQSKPQEWNIVQLGMTELGDVSLSANAKAAELWPDHIVKIRIAIKSIKK